MAQVELKTRIAQKIDSTANWQASTLVLLKGELAFTTDGKYKIGDGTKTWSQLEFPVAQTEFSAAVDPTTSDVGVLGSRWVNTDTNDVFILTDLDPVTWEKVMFADDVYTKGQADALLAGKVDKVDGKGLSTNDYTDAEKALVATIESKAVKADVDAALALKADAASVYTKTESDAALALKANAADVYTKTESDAALALKANAADVYTKTEVDGQFTEKLATKADLVDGFVPASQLPSFVDDVLEFASLSAFPAEGESAKIYVAIDTNLTYRWSGTQYVEISASLALGETASTAFPGDRGKQAEADIDALEGRATALEEKTAGLKALAYKDTVATADIDDAAVSAAKIADGAVETAKIADSAVTTAKIADANVTTEKLADAAVTDAKIASVSLSKVTQAADEELVLNCGGAGVVSA